MRICLIASSRFPVREPYQGGLEAHTAMLADQLIRRGHTVSLFAAPSSDERFNIEHLDVGQFESSTASRRDVGALPEEWMREHHAYLKLMLMLIKDGQDRFDIVHNNSLHHLPVAMAGALPVPMVSTLHTPPLAWLESAITVNTGNIAFTSVSRYTAKAWAHVTPSRTILNGVDTNLWKAGPGGSAAVWTGRLVPEKAPHFAVLAARKAGMSLRLAGARLDSNYFEHVLAPLLGDGIEYVGHLCQQELVTLVGESAVALVSPAWDEPFGLVAAEAMACGTPVAAFARGALPEIVGRVAGRLATPDDVGSLAEATIDARRIDRTKVRAYAVEQLGVDPMVDGYQRLYKSEIEGPTR
ncbi:glycosyltransferase [Homoserinimonas sp. OAct 916]|uniref:glycosyltransferase n=1 Tax=Homoserinimonas sp. OAct 916 TaxID=2211450 RepID=UPI000DBE5A93|nr:glycosyltransferase [Homoserinimonas sp. OAct 916]